MIDSAPAGDTLETRAFGAFGWSLVNVLVGRLGTMAIGVALARLLGPHEFGTYAIAYVALVFVLSFSELGVSLAIVRWPGDPKEITATVNTISLAASVALAGAAWVLAPTFTRAMGGPDATPVVQLLTLNIIISGLVQTPAALLQREFRQKARTLCDQVNVWVGAVTSLALAASGTGAMSLAAGRLAGAATSAVLLLALSPLPYRLGLRRDTARALLSFGVPLAGASLLFFLVGYLDQVLTGQQLGARQLGFYVLAVNVAGWPLAVLSLPLRSVTPALFARLRSEPDRLHSGLATITSLIARVAVPGCVGLALVAGPLVDLVFGARWHAAAGPLAWLAILAVVRILHELAYDFLAVLGQTRGLLAIQGLWLVALLPAVVIGARTGGTAGVALGQVLVATVVVLPAYGAQLRRHGVSLRTLGRSLATPVAAGTALAVALWLLAARVQSGALTLLMSGLLTAAVVGGLLFPMRQQLVSLRRGTTGHETLGGAS